MPLFSCHNSLRHPYHLSLQDILHVSRNPRYFEESFTFQDISLSNTAVTLFLQYVLIFLTAFNLADTEGWVGGGVANHPRNASQGRAALVRAIWQCGLMSSFCFRFATILALFL